MLASDAACIELPGSQVLMAGYVLRALLRLSGFLFMSLADRLELARDASNELVKRHLLTKPSVLGRSFVPAAAERQEFERESECAAVKVRIRKKY